MVFERDKQEVGMDVTASIAQQNGEFQVVRCMHVVFFCCCLFVCLFLHYYLIVLFEMITALCVDTTIYTTYNMSTCMLYVPVSDLGCGSYGSSIHT